MSAEPLGIPIAGWVQWVGGLIAGFFLYLGKLAWKAWNRVHTRIDAAHTTIGRHAQEIEKIAAIDDQLNEYGAELERIKPMADKVADLQCDMTEARISVASLKTEQESVCARLDNISTTTRDTNQKLDGLIRMMLERNQ